MHLIVRYEKNMREEGLLVFCSLFLTSPKVNLFMTGHWFVDYNYGFNRGKPNALWQP